MSDIYLYKNQLWLPKYDFRYTGEPKEFTLNPGKYLFICHGARGGEAASAFINRGGSSYGVMNLEQTTTMYAVVGGDGEAAIKSDTVRASGGYNGGGNGGKSAGNYFCGAGGGGASDVRLSVDDNVTVSEIHSIPDEFEELEYIENNQPISIRTGIIPSATTDVEVDAIVYQPDWSQWMYMFGCRNGGAYGSDSQCFEFKVRDSYNYGFYWLINTGNNIQRHDGIYGERIQVKTHGSSVTVSQNGVEKFSITSTEQRVDSTINPYSDIIVFNANQGYDDSVNDGGADPSKMRLYSFKVYQNGELSNCFVPCRTKNVDVNIGEVVLEAGNIVSTGDSDSNTRVRTKGSIRWDVTTQPRQIQMYAKDIDGNDLQVNMLLYNRNGSLLLDDYWYDSGHTFFARKDTYTIRFCVRYADDRNITPDMIGSFSFKYVDGEIGIYDIINGTFHPDVKATSFSSDDYVVGDVVEKNTTVTINRPINVSLLSRIIVAGGGGGGNYMSSQNYPEFTGYGGGVNGGYPYGNNSMVNNMKESTQYSGHEFGQGQNAKDRVNNGSSTYGMEGLCGGGGGWYGGYAPDTVNTKVSHTAANGGGGSGYVYTESSYKPDGYMNGYEDRDDLKFTDIFMDAGSAEESMVLICKPVSAYNAGDRIICPCVGEGNRFPLFEGMYTVKCYGGFGAHRYLPSAVAKGGYAQGTFTNPEYQNAYVHVGGSGFFAVTGKDALFTQSTFPTLCYNGGGNPSSFGGGVAYQAEAAGGGTDLRIGSDSLLARIIVAGGGGGTGRDASRGGAGGGSTGGSHNGNGCGTNYGVGTQTAAGAGADTRVSGGFGYGGDGVSQNGGYGGAGGGGWYGGSGTIPDSSADDDYAGCGGSGYVLTEESFKPEGYMLDERYYMTDTVLTQGGNNLPIGITKLTIDCLEVHNAIILCKDDEGYKSFNGETGVWEFISSKKPSVAEFEQYGVYKMTTDEGLLNDYEVHVLDQSNQGVNTAAFTVVPPKQTIKTKKYTPNFINELTIDADVDSTNVDFEVRADRKGVAESARIELTMTVDIHDEQTIPSKVYCAHAYTQGKASSYKDPKPKEKTIDHIDLLPVGIGNRLPSRYKSYLGGFLDDEKSEAITEISSAVSCERNRSIYSAVLCNNNIVRIVKLNLITNKSTKVKDIPKGNLGNNYIGDILVDEEYIYLTSAYSNNSRILYRIPLDPNDNTVNQYTPGTSNDYCFLAFGKMEWWNDHTIIICHRCGFLLFDTIGLTWTIKNKGSNMADRYDFAVGKKYAMAVYGGNSNSAWVCDIETNTWYDYNTWGAWNASYQNCCCYANGYFYVTQQHYLYIVNEETMLIEKTVVTPYSTLTPKTINYAGGVLYITTLNSAVMYIYDIKNDRFTSATLPFSMKGWDRVGWHRPTTFRGYFFIPDIRLFVTNFVEYAKYNVGYKYDQFMFITNSEFKDDYEYDERFVSFTDSYMTIHNGDIKVPLEVIDESHGIYMAEMKKSQYNKFLSIKFINERKEDDGSDGNETDGNE